MLTNLKIKKKSYIPFSLGIFTHNLEKKNQGGIFYLYVASKNEKRIKE